MSDDVRNLVWTWLDQCGRSELLFSDLTRALITQRRVWHRDLDDPRGEIRAALNELAAEGRVLLAPTTKTGRAGRPGVRIEVLDSTHEMRNT